MIFISKSIKIIIDSRQNNQKNMEQKQSIDINQNKHIQIQKEIETPKEKNKEDFPYRKLKGIYLRNLNALHNIQQVHKRLHSRNCLASQEFKTEKNLKNAQLEISQYNTLDLFELMHVVTGLGYPTVIIEFSLNNSSTIDDFFLNLSKAQSFPKTPTVNKRSMPTTSTWVKINLEVFSVNFNSEIFINIIEVQNYLVWKLKNIFSSSSTTILSIPLPLIISIYEYWIGVYVKKFQIETEKIIWDPCQQRIWPYNYENESYFRICEKYVSKSDLIFFSECPQFNPHINDSEVADVTEYFNSFEQHIEYSHLQNRGMMYE
jgi:hypothetical protein